MLSDLCRLIQAAINRCWCDIKVSLVNQSLIWAQKIGYSQRVALYALVAAESAEQAHANFQNALSVFRRHL